MFKTRPDGGHEWFKQLGLLELTQEAEGGASNELIWMLEILCVCD